MTASKRERNRNIGAREPERQEAEDEEHPGDGAHEGPPDQPAVTADEAKLRLLFLMKLRGCNQREMAKHFDVTERTIRNWSRQLNSLKFPVLTGLDPSDELGRILCRFAAREADLLDIKGKAEATGDLRTSLACVRELRQLAKERYEFLTKIGFFAGIEFAPPGEVGPRVVGSHVMAELIGGFFDLDFCSPTNGTPPRQGHK